MSGMLVTKRLCALTLPEVHTCIFGTALVSDVENTLLHLSSFFNFHVCLSVRFSLCLKTNSNSYSSGITKCH